MLTYIRIASAKPAEAPYTLSDGDGLLLCVQPNGSKLWHFRYRYLGRQKNLHIGRWPDVPLADARARCEEARRQVAAGLDPAQLRLQLEKLLSWRQPTPSARSVMSGIKNASTRTLR